MQQSTNALAKNSFNSIKALYLLFAFWGVIAPWFWLLQDPSAIVYPTLFLQRAFENNVAADLTSEKSD